MGQSPCVEGRWPEGLAKMQCSMHDSGEGWPPNITRVMFSLGPWNGNERRGECHLGPKKVCILWAIDSLLFSVWAHRERALPGPVLAAHRARLPHVHPRLLPHLLCIQGILIPHHLKGRPQKIAYFLSASGSMPLTNRSWCGSGFSSVTFKMSTKVNFFLSKFLCLFLF